jgi:hypothetical protein
MAKTYKKELNALMPVIYPADFNGAAWQLKIMNDAILGDQVHFTKGVAVSNIGKANFMAKQDENLKLKLIDMYFCASLRSGGKTMQIFVDSVEDLNICFAHSEPLLNKTHADKIRVNTITILKNVIQAEMQNEPVNTRLNRVAC